MSDKYLDKDGLLYLLTKIKTLSDLGESFIFDGDSLLIGLVMGNLKITADSNGWTIDSAT